MKILVFGKGYIGNKFVDYFDGKAVLSDVRIENYSEVKKEIETQEPDVVINCAGKTGRPNVDWCEDNKMETMASNVLAPLILARVCEVLNVYMVHIGSGCVYEGGFENGFVEGDEPNFDGSFYSRTKAVSESMLKEFPVLQLRIRMPFDSEPGPRNFVTKIVKYDKVISVPNSITIMDDFFPAAEKLIEKHAIGIYNMTNPGVIDHSEILDMYKELVDPNYDYEVFSLEELEKITSARRSNCGLSTGKLEKEGIFMRPVREAVRDSLIKYRQAMV